MSNINYNKFTPMPIPDILVLHNFPFIEQDFDSLNLYQMLCKIASIVTYIEDYLQTLDFSQYTDYVDDQIASLRTYIDNKDNALYKYIDKNDNDLKTLIESKLNDAKIYTDTKIAELNNSLLIYIDDKIENIKNYTDNQDNLLKIYIDNEISKLQKEIEDIAKNGIKVYNPVRGTYEYLQGTLDDLYGFLRYEGLTALEYDSLGLTAEQYDNKNLTARQYDLYARLYLWFDPRVKMYSPFTGKITLITEVIQQLANFHKENPITCEEYDSLELTANDYDTKEITAYNFDFTGKSILIP